MFKRVAKRQHKREKEEELGLDEELKQVLGLQDTDSDESFDSDSDSESGNDSDLDSGSSETDGGEGDLGGSAQSRKRKRSVEGPGEDYFAGMDSLSSESADGDVEDDDSPPMGVMAATTQPIYDVPDAPVTQDLRACILCPGKLLKNAKMVGVHAESTAHLRRLQKYIEQVSKLTSSPEGLTTDDPRVILRNMAPAANSELVGQPQDSSKRSQRRTAWKAKQAERKKAQKQSKGKDSTVPKERDVRVIVDGDHDSSIVTKGRKPKKSEEKTDSSEVVPMSMIVDLPALISAEKPGEQGIGSGRKSKSPRKPLASDSAEHEHPTKRQKHEISFATSSPAASGMDASSVTQPHPKKASNRPSHSKPVLKRHNTSLYFADDEKRSGFPDQSSDRRHSVGRNEGEKHAKSVSETKRQSERRRGGRDVHVQGSARGRGKRDVSRGLTHDERQPRGGLISGGRGKGKALVGQGMSAEQWGSGKILQVFE